MHQVPFAFFAPGPWELLVIGGIVLLLFGSRLPGAMRSLGKSFVEFKKGVKGVEEDEQSGDARPAGEKKPAEEAREHQS